jgi:uncharacterized oxidoreductase
VHDYFSAAVTCHDTGAPPRREYNLSIECWGLHGIPNAFPFYATGPYSASHLECPSPAAYPRIAGPGISGEWFRCTSGRTVKIMNINGNNTIFIPGATSGLGLGLALRLQAAGNTVIVGGRRTALLREIASAHPGIDTVEIDTSDAESISAAAATLTERHPALNTLITMAGIMEPENLLDPASIDVAERTISVNLLGTIRLVHAFLPHLLTEPDATLMTVSSGLAFVPLPATPTYNATKAAVHSFTESLRVQLTDTSVRVVELVPPAVQTTLMGQEDSPTAMPYDEFLDEVMSLLGSQPDAPEILVERVKFLRNATAEGRYDEVLGALSGRSH